MVGSVASDGEVSGSFEQRPFARLLILALDQRWTGALEIDDAGAVHVLQFERGLCGRVLVPDDFARLGELLCERGIIMEGELGLALSERGPVGQAMVRLGLIDEPTLQRALVLQVLTRMVRLFSFPPEATWRFIADDGRFERQPPGWRIDTPRALWAGLEVHGPNEERMRSVLAPYAEIAVVIRDGVKLDRFGFRGEALAVTAHILGEMPTLPELEAAGVAPTDICRRVVYVLSITRFLAPLPNEAEGLKPISSRPSSPSLASGPPSSDDPPSSSNVIRKLGKIQVKRVAVSKAVRSDPGSNRDLGDTTPGGGMDGPRREVLEMLERLPKETPFTLLGVDPAVLAGASDEEATQILWAAYDERSRQWQPDACPAELADVAQAFGRIHDAISNAFVALGDARRRAEHLRAAGFELEPDSCLAPSELHERALYEMSQRAFDEALRLCELASQGDPQQADYRATKVWIRAHLPHPDFKVLTLDLDEILLIDRDHVQARFYRAMLRKRLGLEMAAKQDFERVLTIDPGHAGARQELAALAAARV